MKRIFVSVEDLCKILIVVVLAVLAISVPLITWVRFLGIAWYSRAALDVVLILVGSTICICGLQLDGELDTSRGPWHLAILSSIFQLGLFCVGLGSAALLYGVITQIFRGLW
jgi:hypothetical protein